MKKSLLIASILAALSLTAGTVAASTEPKTSTPTTTAEPFPCNSSSGGGSCTCGNNGCH